MKTTLTEGELKEIICKLANELEDYGDSATYDLQKAFMKLYNMSPVNYTKLVEKWSKNLEGIYGSVGYRALDTNISGANNNPYIGGRDIPAIPIDYTILVSIK